MTSPSASAAPGIPIEGACLLPATVEQSWNALTDVNVLENCIGGCEDVQETGPHAWRARVTVPIGPFKMGFDARLSLTDVRANDAYRLHVNADSKLAGSLNGHADVQLMPRDAATLLEYTGEVHVDGKVAKMGHKVLGEAVQRAMNVFWKRLASQLAERGKA